MQECATCEGSQNICLACADSNKYLLNGACLALPCPSSTFAEVSIKKCIQCLKPCLTCTNSSHCLTCDPLSPWKILSNGQCLERCPVDFPLLLSNGCEKCSD